MFLVPTEENSFIFTECDSVAEVGVKGIFIQMHNMTKTIILYYLINHKHSSA